VYIRDCPTLLSERIASILKAEEFGKQLTRRSRRQTQRREFGLLLLRVLLKKP
jgi:hypothetical protein